MRFAISAALTALILAACGQSDSTTTTVGGQTVTTTQSGDGTTYTFTGPDGATATASAGQVPADLPDYAPLYPGAAVQGSYTGASAQGGGGVMSFKTAAPVDDVIKFYKDRAAAANFAEAMNLTSNGTTMFTASNQQTNASLSVTVTPATEGGGNDVVLTWSTPTGG